MNLIRNGNFEALSLLHWSMKSAGSLALDTVNSHRGARCVKLTSAGAAREYFQNCDYVKVESYELLILSAWVMSASIRNCSIHVVEYDESLIEINSTLLTELVTDPAYQWLSAEYAVSGEACYVGIQLSVAASANGTTYYFDDVKVHRYDYESEQYNSVELCDLAGVIFSGSTSTDKHDRKGFATYLADLNVSAQAGTNPTLDVKVVELDGHGNLVTVGTFAQMVAVGSERISLTNITGNQMYVSYVLGGTNPVYAFEVIVTGKG